MKSNMLRSNRAAALVVAVCTLAVLTIASLGIIAYTLNSYRTSSHKRMMEQAQIAAMNELELLFYRWATEVTNGGVEGKLRNTQGITKPEATVNSGNGTDSAFIVSSDLAADEYNPVHSPYLNSTDTHLSVARGLTLIPVSALGKVQSKTGYEKTGSVRYYKARVAAQITNPLLGTVTARVGRRFAVQSVSPFNFSVYYQNDLEFGAGTDMYVEGDIEANGNIYIGVAPANDPDTGEQAVLTIGNNLYYLGKFNGIDNGTTDPTTYTPHHKMAQDTSLTDGRWDRYLEPTFSDSRANQVKKMTGSDNFIGGIDVEAAAKTFPDAYAKEVALPATSDPGYAAALAEKVNDVYRSIVAPPPTKTDGTLEPENPVVAANRMYNKAFLRIQVGPGTTVTVTNTATNTTVSAGSVVPTVRKPVYDAREKADVNMTDIDIGALGTLINNTPALKDAYNGVVYIYDANTTSGEKNGIRLINGATTPDVNDTGFTVATNNGLYVKGSYNTAIDADTGEIHRTALMGDAVTILSAGWNDDNAHQPFEAADGTPLRRATADIVINSAIVSGNTASNSGGVQNLVRYLEDWYAGGNGHTSTLKGSIDQLFQSKYFNSEYIPTSYAQGTADQVYSAPTHRDYIFDKALASNPPAGTPTSSVSYFRGDLFEW